MIFLYKWPIIHPFRAVPPVEWNSFFLRKSIGKTKIADPHNKNEKTIKNIENMLINAVNCSIFIIGQWKIKEVGYENYPTTTI
jgi:hypothetical protein